MLFRSTILAALMATVSAVSSRKNVIQPAEDFTIPANSKIGKKLLKNARRLENNNQQEDQDPSFMAGFSIKYDSCASLIQVREEGNQDEGILYNQNLVKFTLCPGATAGCEGCGSGAAQYVVNMMEFVDAYTEMKLEAQEYACEMIREYCYCDNANDDDACEYQCYVDAGMDVCIEYEGGEEFEIQRYLECAELEGNDGNNNNNNNNGQNYNYNNNNNNGGVDMYRQYYVGPMCSPKDGKSIHMAVFQDAGCTAYAGTGIFEAFNYGMSLPFESEPIVELNDCISCMQVDEDNNNNNNQNNNNNNNGNNNNNQNYNYYQDAEVLELCEQSYEMAAKCENGLSDYVGQYFYPDTTGCEYINNILPRLDRATRKISGGSSAVAGAASPAATAFAVIFALTSIILGAYAFFLYRKIHRAKVNLAQAEMGIA